jgi:hypothetical protein
MPITIWNLLPSHHAYRFIGFVTSGNAVTTSGASLTQIVISNEYGDSERTTSLHLKSPSNNEVVDEDIARGKQNEKSRTFITTIKSTLTVIPRKYNARDSQTWICQPFSQRRQRHREHTSHDSSFNKPTGPE